MRHRRRSGGELRAWVPSNWALWKLPTAALAYLLLTELGAVAVLVASPLEVPPPALLAVLGLLCACTVLHTEFVIGFEHIRLRMTAHTLGRNIAVRTDLTTVWTFAAALMLPLWMTAALVVLMQVHMYWRVIRPLDGRPFRAVFAGVTIVLAAAGVRGVEGLGLPVQPWDGIVDITELGALLCVSVAYMVTQFGLMAVVVALVSRDLGKIRAVGTAGMPMLEVTAACLGVLLANLLGSGLAWTAVLMVPALLLLDRGTAEHQLEATAREDAGVLNTSAWHRTAQGALRRAISAGQGAGLLVIDLDQFWRFNEAHGAAAGDRALAAVGRALKDCGRDGDVVGRLGADEFAVLAPAADTADVARLAQRALAAVAGLPSAAGAGPAALTASTGMAICPRDAVELHELLAAADRSLRAAKQDGPSSIGALPPPPGAELLRRRAPGTTPVEQ